MYHDYFGLTEPAFSIAVNPKYLYMSSQHKEALAHLVYGVQGGGFVLLSGEVGTGKTTIVRCLLEQMPGDTEIAFVLNPMADVDALLSTICEELNIAIFADEKIGTKQIMDRLQGHLLANHAKGKRTVLLIDEAQLLSADVLEQIRLLTNLETSTDKLLQIVLVGQPEVNDLLSQPRLRQLSQRITARFHLEALSLVETKRYIEHRLQVAGKKEGRVIFPDKIIKKIHAFSGGIPRLINIICERLLVGAYGHNKFEVDNAIYQRALPEVAGALTRTETKRAKEKPYLLATFIVMLITIIGLSTVILKNSISTAPLDSSSSSLIEESESDQAATSNTEEISELQAPVPALTEPEDNTGPPQEVMPTYLLNNSQAFAKLFLYYDVPIATESHPCWQTEQHQLSCVKDKFETWQALQELNRPVILSMITADKNLSYVVLVGLNQAEAFILDSEGTVITKSKREVGELWNGSVSFVWRKPIGYKTPLSIGTRSPVTKWVAEKFALLDGQTTPITGTLFNQRLQTRVKIFQSSAGLEQDGILGERTLMKLNERLGLGLTLINELP